MLLQVRGGKSRYVCLEKKKKKKIHLYKLETKQEYNV